MAEAYEIDLRHSHKAAVESLVPGYRPETVISLFKLLLMAFGGIATEDLDSSPHCFERLGPCRPTSLRAQLTAASTQPRTRFAN
ncbi:MAG: hypothetical protein OXN96_10435 [Bryobacterales bacterium]|nr:hypothetical protein [Bryobacterales bacterium]